MCVCVCVRFEKREALKARFEIEQKLRRQKKKKQKEAKQKRSMRHKRSKQQDRSKSQAMDEYKAKRSAGMHAWVGDCRCTSHCLHRLLITTHHIAQVSPLPVINLYCQATQTTCIGSKHRFHPYPL